MNASRVPARTTRFGVDRPSKSAAPSAEAESCTMAAQDDRLTVVLGRFVPYRFDIYRSMRHLVRIRRCAESLTSEELTRERTRICMANVSRAHAMCGARLMLAPANRWGDVGFKTAVWKPANFGCVNAKCTQERCDAVGNHDCDQTSGLPKPTTNLRSKIGRRPHLVGSATIGSLRQINATFK
jgi:hypothetical protein